MPATVQPPTSPAAILRTADHRPWPLPGSPWIMRQTWRELLFAHWALPPEALRPRLPAGLALDTYEGRAWLGAVPFRMTGVRLRSLPPIPTTFRLGEINLRTYVVAEDKPGVLFFSLDASSPLAVAGARLAYFLPYFLARFSIDRRGDAVTYASRRAHPGAPAAEFAGTYRPIGPVFTPHPGSLADWLTARYCLYTAGPRGRLYRGEIHHGPWPLQPAALELAANTMASCSGMELPDSPPLLHYAERIDMLAWPLRRVRGA
jgi:uncharacterized protein YqjF (DUF2071 family)